MLFIYYAGFVWPSFGDIDLVALRDLDGCQGGSVGQELTIDYRKTLLLSGVATAEQELPCQP